MMCGYKMNFLLSKLKLAATVFALATLVACGGGGGGDVAAPVSSPAPQNIPLSGSGTGPSTAAYSQADAKSVAGLGFVAADYFVEDIQRLQDQFANFTQGFLSVATSRTPGTYSTGPLACASIAPGATGGSGTVTTVITITGAPGAASRVGFVAGDKLAMTYNQCKFSSTESFFQNGTVEITSKETYVNLGVPSAGAPSPPFRFHFNLKLTNFIQDASFGKYAYNGSFDVVRDQVTNTSIFASTVTAKLSSSVFEFSTSTIASLSTDLETGLLMDRQRAYNSASSIPDTVTLSVNGNVYLGTRAADTLYKYLTPSANKPSGSRINLRTVPTTGQLNFKDVAGNLATETTWSGNVVNVKADSDRNGTLDLNFNTTHAALITF
jgi:hypothetical protein